MSTPSSYKLDSQIEVTKTEPHLPPLMTSGPVELRDEPRYLTLSVNSFSTTYITTILLGNSFATVPSTPFSTATPELESVHVPGIPTGTIVGIVVGCVAGFFLLLCVFYIHILKMRQSARMRRSRSSRSKSRSSSGGSGSTVCEIYLITE